MNPDVDAIRARFPSLSTQDNGVSRIYFDNPAGTQVPASVAKAVADSMIDSCANQGGPFRTSRLVNELIKDARHAMADLLNAESVDEIIFGQSMTALTFSLSRSIGPTLEAGDEIVVSQMDHDANITPWVMMARDHDLRIRWLPFSTETYEFDLADLDELLTDRTRMVCVGGASNLTGTLHDIRTICAKARDAGAMSFIDGVQSVPHVPTDVQDIGCDFLACSAYKFFGPHQGVLWGRREAFAPLTAYQVRPASPVIPGNFETGTPSFELMAGTKAAVEYFDWIGTSMAADYLDRYKHLAGRRQRLHAAMALLTDYEQELSSHLIAGLQSIRGITVHGVTDADAMRRRVPTVSFTSGQKDPQTIAEALAEENMFVWHGHNYAVEVVKTLGLDDSGGVVRVGPVHYNTQSELDRLLDSLESRVLRA
ncbi:MAG: cysteine desulfurase-like protein [Woeseiaceae bacterium]|nr:cysteine desulfurase-like protein [Woeseiaceae bacterium]